MRGNRIDSSGSRLRSRTIKRRASGLVRTFVVGSATLAILLVCFSIYQSAQVSGVAQPRNKVPRLSESRSSSNKNTNDNSGTSKPIGVEVGGATITSGKDFQLSLYSSDTAEPFGELSAQGWVPDEQLNNTWRVASPVFRFWTKDRHGMRLTAKEGLLEGQRKLSGFEPRRVTLMADVVLEYDRLSRDERERLPADQRDRLDPSQIVRIETQRIEFDREYGKLLIPGDVRAFSPLDLDFRTSDVEVRFNEAESRVESMRIGRGGKLEVRGLAGQFGLSVPEAGGGTTKRLTVVDWLRMSMEAQMEARAKAQAAEATSTKPGQSVTIGDDGVPTFHVNAAKPKAKRESMRYLAKFEQDIDARQYRGDTMLAQLLADVLEIDRSISQDEGQPKSAASGPKTGTAAPSQAPAQPTERMVLEWKGVLTVTADAGTSGQNGEPVRSKMTARGAPVRLTHPEGTAECLTLVHEPDKSTTLLVGSLDAPVVVNSPEQGRMEGAEVLTEQGADRLFVRVTGPGEMTPASDSATADPTTDETADEKPKDVAGVISFGESMEIVGRVVRMTRLDFSGGINTGDVRVIDRAAFTGGVKLRDGDTKLSAETLDAAFSPPTRRSSRQGIDQLKAAGDVEMVRGESRLTGRELDAKLTVTADGKMVPSTATITGDAQAMEGDRSIKAADRLVVDFGEIKEAIVEEAGVASTGKKRTWGAQRVRAFSEVSVVDSRQGLDLSVEELDATINENNELETATLKGTAEKPAIASLEDFSVVGREITLNAQDEWADVPGEGRMTFRSLKDLDGRRLDEPIPIVINWSESMRYRGRENQAVFSGQVHATSESSTKFDTEQLVVEFENVAPSTETKPSGPEWWILEGAANAIGAKTGDDSPKLTGSKFSKEPARLIATGRAVALTSEVDPNTGKLKSRARLEGPRLSVDLRREVAKMLIEGKGLLLLEDFSEPAPPSQATARAKSDPKGLFTMDEEAGLSKTLITWNDAMWYDFSIDQTRFEGDVDLKFFSGTELAKIADISKFTTRELTSGRSTFLKSNLLTVDFKESDSASTRSDDQRMGRLSAQGVRQFRAAGNVDLQDIRSKLTMSLKADEIVYERDRDLLAIHGLESKPAHMITLREKGSSTEKEAPVHSKFLRAFYEISTNKLEVTTPIVGQ